MKRLYSNIEDAKAFAISFTNFVYDYDDMNSYDFCSELCESCGRTVQNKDYMVPKSNCKKPYGILSSYEFGVDEELRNALIENFDITEEDFRPIRSKRGEIVFYQITPRHTMLPLRELNKWRSAKPCPKCGSFYYHDRAFENEKGEDYYYISQECLDEMHDLNVTYEKFSKFYLPMFVISRRVYNFLVDRYPQTHYFPFFIK